MSTPANTIETFANQDYKWGFVSDIAAHAIPAGLSEDVVRLISRKKNEPAFMLEWRLKAYRHWLTMKEPEWANVHYPAIDYQKIIYYAAPKTNAERPKSLDEVDPELLRTYEKLGIPCRSASCSPASRWTRSLTASRSPLAWRVAHPLVASIQSEVIQQYA